jgi:hypothetical protein
MLWPVFKEMKLSKMVAALILMVLLLAQLEPQTKTNKGKNKMAQHDDDNRSQQLNPEHDAYWQSRGEDERPEDWEERLDD